MLITGGGSLVTGTPYLEKSHPNVVGHENELAIGKVRVPAYLRQYLEQVLF